MSGAHLEYDYAAAGPVRRRMRTLVALRPLAWASARLLPLVDRVVFRLTGGRVTLSAWVTGLPIVELVTTGARSGSPRPARVSAIPVDGGYVVVAANFGQTTNPAWYYNLRANPEATLTANGAVTTCRARELFADERDRGLELAASLNPGVRRFQERAGQRSIPVMFLAVET